MWQNNTFLSVATLFYNFIARISSKKPGNNNKSRASNSGIITNGAPFKELPFLSVCHAPLANAP